MDQLWQQIQTAITLYLPSVLLAIGILIVGWIVAIVLARVVRSLLNRTQIDDRIARSIGGDPSASADQIQIERWISMAVFWLVMLFTIIGFFNVLNFTVVAGPLNNLLNDIVAYIPAILGALVLLVLAWILATILRAIVVRLLNASGLSRRLTDEAGVEARNRVSISQTIGNVVYWLVFLLFLPAILDALNLQGLLTPVQGLVDEILGVLPNILAAALILVIGWLVARIVRQIVTNLLASMGIDRYGEQAGVTSDRYQVQLSNVIGTVVYILILIPVAIAALNALNIPAISQPASDMLTNLLAALPAIFGALVLIGIAYIVARLLGGFLAGVLANLGFDRLFTRLGLYKDTYIPEVPTSPRADEPAAASVERRLRRLTPSRIAGGLVTIAILLFAVMEAADMLNFDWLAMMISQFIVVAGKVLVGLVIFGFGLYLANLADQMIRDSGSRQAYILAPAARIAILIFAGALALREMGIAESIVNLAFGLLLGAIAVAIALAFGLGGRDIAARQLERWRQDLQSGPPASLGAGEPSEQPLE